MRDIIVLRGRGAARGERVSGRRSERRRAIRRGSAMRARAAPTRATDESERGLVHPQKNNEAEIIRGSGASAPPSRAFLSAEDCVKDCRTVPIGDRPGLRNSCISCSRCWRSRWSAPYDLGRGLQIVKELAARSVGVVPTAAIGGGAAAREREKAAILEALRPYGDPALGVPAATFEEVDASCRRLERLNPASTRSERDAIAALQARGECATPTRRRPAMARWAHSEVRRSRSSMWSGRRTPMSFRSSMGSSTSSSRRPFGPSRAAAPRTAPPPSA